ncbi:unnamed protein product, partial [Ectocarpus sp. 12 AP-2014]
QAFEGRVPGGRLDDARKLLGGRVEMYKVAWIVSCVRSEVPTHPFLFDNFSRYSSNCQFCLRLSHQLLYQLVFDLLLEVLVLAATEDLSVMCMHTCSQRSNVVQ